MEKITYLEQQLNTSVDLLEIAKDYCEFNQDNSAAICTVLSLLEVVLMNQKKIISELDKIA